MTTTARHGRIGLACEIALAAIVVASVVGIAHGLVVRGYLPQPFLPDTNDTFMDWFNTAYWANNPGAYDVWRTIYPPLSFVFLDVFSLPGCYLSSPFHARDCDWLGQAAILGWYVIGIALAWLAFRRADQRTAPWRAIAFAIGLPTLFALERGNLVIPCLAFFAVAYGDIVRPGWKRWIAIGVTINFKPYLLLPALALAIRRDWRALEAAGIATVALYVLTIAIVGAGGPLEMIANARNWVSFVGGQVWEQIYYSTSYSPLLWIETTSFPVLRYIPSRAVEPSLWWVPVVIRAGQLLTLACLAGAWLQPGALPLHRLAALLLAMSLSAQSPGGYTQAFLIFLVFLEPWRRPGPIVAIVAAYLLSISADWILAPFPPINGKSWLGDRSVVATFGMAIGQFMRPGLIIVILWALALDSLYRIVRAHRDHRPSLGLAPQYRMATA